MCISIIFICQLNSIFVFLSKIAGTSDEPLRFQCDICPKTFSSAAYLNIHVKSVHIREAATEGSKNFHNLSGHQYNADLPQTTADYSHTDAQLKSDIPLNLGAEDDPQYYEPEPAIKQNLLQDIPMHAKKR